MKNKKLTKEIKEFLKARELDITQEAIIMWYGFSEFQMDTDTCWSPCEDCDNINCNVKDDFPIWFCADQK